MAIHESNQNSSKGFTILELLIATTIFSIILLLASMGVIQLGRLYYKGITTSKTQETARSVSEEISRTAQLTSDELTGPFSNFSTGTQSVCIGVNRYTYLLNRKIGDSGLDHALWYDTDRPLPGAPCNNDYDFNNPNITKPDGTASNGRELLSSNMRLLNLNINFNPANKTTTVAVRVAYGDNDLLTHYDDSGNPNGNPASTANCKSSIPGSSFCAVAGLDTVVRRRIN